MCTCLGVFRTIFNFHTAIPRSFAKSNQVSVNALRPLISESTFDCVLIAEAAHNGNFAVLARALTKQNRCP